MDSEQWSQVRELCTEASKLAPAERDAFLRQHCAGKPELMAEVVSLLDSSDGATVVAGSGSGPDPHEGGFAKQPESGRPLKTAVKQ